MSQLGSKVPGRAVALAIFLVLALTTGGSGALAGGYASIVLNAANGEQIYGVSADEPRYPASLTKVMTLYLAFEALDSGRAQLHDRIRVSAHAAAQPPSKLGLVPGETIAVEDAILALVTKSANDAAAALAEHLGGSEAAFAEQMTARAHALGMTSSTFRNASGLPHPQQVTTARDMATLGRAMITRFPHYYSYFSTPSFHYGGIAHRNHNRMLGTYAGVDGIKTGFINASGFNLIASAKRDDRRLIGVVFGARSSAERARMMAALLDGGFDALDTGTFVETPTMLASVAAPAAERRKEVAGGGWSIRIGPSFASSEQARRQARALAAGLPASLSPEAGGVVGVRSASGARVFAVEWGGLAREEAAAACRQLRARGTSCVVVPGNGGGVVTAARSASKGVAPATGVIAAAKGKTLALASAQATPASKPANATAAVGKTKAAAKPGITPAAGGKTKATLANVPSKPPAKPTAGGAPPRRAVDKQEAMRTCPRPPAGKVVSCREGRTGGTAG